MAERNRTARQARFIDCYSGNIKEAAALAGLSYDYARRLVTKSHIREAIRNRQDTEVRRHRIATRQQRQQFLTKTMNDDSLNTGDRLRASELLGKSEADFIDVVKSDSIMRLQLGAPRALLAGSTGQTVHDAVLEPIEDRSGLTDDEDDHEAV